MNKCDQCGSKIENEKCSCGTWISAEDFKDNPMKLAIEEFHEMKRFTLTGDAPHLGCAVIYFRGDYKDTKNVEKFIYSMKGRSYYEEKDS